MDCSVIVFTPHSVRMGIVEELLHDISSMVEYKIVLRKKTSLTIADIEVMYPRLVKTSFFPRIIECLTGGEAECVLVIADKIHEKINAVKGKFSYSEGKASATGLRAKFQKDECSFEFVFHSTDSNNESSEICMRLFGEKYVVAITTSVK